MPDLVVRNLAKHFGDVTALDHVSFTVADGEFFTLLGPSGCGKSTTLSAIAGLDRPDNGVIQVADTVFVDCAKRTFLQPEERNLGMVFQSYALWPHMTIAGNLALALKLRKVSHGKQRKLIGDALERVGLAAMRERYPHQLSGGQQQRVALARALVYSPSVLLLDEPLSNLDAQLREQARGWLKQLQRDTGITTVYVTHDQLEALSLSDRIAVMGDGRMIQVDTPEEIYERPTDAGVAAFIGRCNFLPATVRSIDDSSGSILLDLDSAEITLRLTADTACTAGEKVTIGIRSERLDLVDPAEIRDDEQNVLTAHLTHRSYVGARFEYQLRLGETTLHAESATPLAGPELAVRVPRRGCLLYPYQDGRADPLAAPELGVAPVTAP